MIKLPPSEFTFGKYNAYTIPHNIIVSPNTKDWIDWLENQNIIGYIEGMELEIRPRTNYYGVMIEDEDGFVSWSHIPDDIFDKFLRDK